MLTKVRTKKESEYQIYIHQGARSRLGINDDVANYLLKGKQASVH